MIKSSKKTKLIKAILGVSLLTGSFTNGFGYAATSENEPIEMNAVENQAVLPNQKFPKASKKERQEIEIKRSENSKTYLNSDGTFTAELFQEPVYWEDDSGKWSDIDNTLVETADVNFEVQNKSNKVKTKFTKDDGTSRIELEGNFIEFIPKGATKKANKKNKNKASYDGIYKDVIIEKIATASGMKENIILNSKKAQTEYTYEIKTSGLMIEKEKDGSIGFYDGEKKSIFTIEKPFAYDARGVMTDKVSMSIVEKGKKTYLVQKLSDAWFQDQTTKLPVVIDPTVIYNKDNSTISDAPVFSCHPTNNYDSWNIPIGAHPDISGCEVQSLLKFDLPMLYAGQIIESASLKINTYSSSTKPTNVQVHQLAKSWDPKTVTWNTKPTPGGTAFDTKRVVNSGTNGGVIDLNVKVPVTNWYKGLSPNHGVLLKAQNKTDEYKVFYASNGAGANLAPRLTITYRLDPLGSESFWGFDNGINLLSGNYVEEATDAVLDGKGIPISVSRTYNSRSISSGALGYGWMFDFDMRIDSADPNRIATLTDTDGTNHAFVYDTINKKWNAPPGIYYDLVYSAGKNATFVITDKSQTKYTFDAAETSVTKGKLLHIKDNNDLTTTYTYDTSGKLTKITDPSSRFVSFTYDSNSRISTISGAQIPKVFYTYDAAGDLTKVEQKDTSGTVLSLVEYGYSNHNLTSVKDKRGNTSEITYDAASDRATGFTQNVTQQGVIKPLRISYEYGEKTDKNGNVTPYTIKTNAKGIKTKYHMDYLGHVIKIEDDYIPYEEGSAVPAQIITNEFVWDGNNLLTEVKDPRSKATLLSYDNRGNLVQATDANNQSEIMKYNSKDTLIQQTGSTSSSSSSAMDDKNNVTDDSDPSGSSTTYKYDSNGNVVENTQSISTAENLILNSGFEGSYSGVYPKQTPSTWSLYNPSTTGTYYLSGTHVNGARGFALVSPNKANKVTFASAFVEVIPTIAYNVSYSVGTLPADAGNVYVRWYAENYAIINDSQVGKHTGSTSWTKNAEQVIAPENAVYARLFIEATNGTVVFDNIQMQEGNLINTNSSLVNDGFETDTDKNGMPDNWIWSTDAKAGPEGIDKTQTLYTGGTGTNKLKISSSASGKWFGQNVNLSGTKASQITLSGWSKSVSIKPASTKNYDVVMKVNFVDGTNKWFYLPFTNSSHDWEYKEKAFTIPKDYKNYVVYARYNSTVGTVWYDDVQAVQTLGNTSVVSRYNLLDNSSFERTLSNGKIENWNVNASKGAIIYRIGDGEKAYSGNYSMRISNSSANSFIASPQMEPLDAGKAYTFSVMAKAVNVGSGTAQVKFDAYNAAGTLLANTYGTIKATGNGEWKRIYVTLSKEKVAALIAAGATKIQPVISVGGIPSSGYMYIDNARFEEGAIVSSASYDASGNYQISESDPAGNKVSYTVDARGNVTQVQFPIAESKTKATYDALDQTTSLETAAGLRIEYVRDANGNVTETKYVQKSNSLLMGSMKQEYNELNEVTKITDQLGYETTYEYDDNGNVSSVMYPNGKSALYAYDNIDQLKKLSFGGGDATTFEYKYDKSGNITQVIQNGSQTTNYSIDVNLNRVNGVTYPAVGGVRNTTHYAYDADDNVTSSVDSKLGTSTYQYNVAGEAMQYSGPNGQVSKTMYDEAGRVSKQTVINGTSTNYVYYEYSDTGALSTLREETSSGTLLFKDAYSYDANGNINKIVHKDGSYVLYTYDAANQLLSERDISASGTETRKITYTYDVMGNRLTMNRGSEVTTYNYDKANRLISYAVNGVSVANTYDESGNTLQNANFKFTYDAQHQLIQVNDLNDNIVAKYEYDHEGKRTKKQVYSANTLNKTEMYYYDSDDLSYITDQNNKLRYSFGRDADGNLLTMTDHTGSTAKTYTYVFNYRGDVTGLLDAAGNQVASYVYESYGRILNQNGSGTTSEGKPLYSENPFKYASYFHDQETNYYYLMARYYNGAQGRFLSTDEVADDNLYIYVDNNPIIRSDHDGTSWQSFATGSVGKLKKKAKGAWISTKSAAYNAKTKIKKGIKTAKKTSKALYHSLDFESQLGVGYGGSAKIKGHGADFSARIAPYCTKSECGFVLGGGISGKMGRLEAEASYNRRSPNKILAYNEYAAILKKGKKSFGVESKNKQRSKKSDIISFSYWKLIGGSFSISNDYTEYKKRMK